MHKYWDQIIKLIIPVLLSLLLIPIPLFGQGVADPAKDLLEIQHRYHSGELDVQQAALQQFRILYEPAEGKLHKCAAPAQMFFEAHRDELGSEVVDEIEQLEASGVKSMKLATESHISPSGKFEIVYETTGADSVSAVDEDGNGVPDYVDLVAASADSSYRHLVLNIGFKDPIPAGTTYRIELKDVPYYGETRTTGSFPQTYIIVENDFEGFAPNTHPEGDQVGAVYATVAHELKHAVQYAQNRWSSPSGAFNWAEMDATLMEEVVYDDVNDYYNYIKNGLNSPNPNSASLFFAPQDGTPGAYWHVSWMIFYSEYFGDEIWREVWELIENDNFLSIDNALREVLPVRDTDFATTFIRNHLWHFASGSRVGEDDYGFGEKEFYPYANVEDEFIGVPENEIEMADIRTLAARYFEITPSSGDEGFVDVAVDFDSTQVGVGLLFYLKNGEMLEIISKGENKSQDYVPTEIAWQDIQKVGVVLANYSNDTFTGNPILTVGKNGNAITIRDPEFADLPKSIKIYQNYPNPFNPETTIDFELPRAAFVTLEIFDITGKKVQTLTRQLYRLGTYSIPFNASGLSSGIYFYRLKIGDMIFTKKMTLAK